jgi:hypothetical protein
VVQVPQWATSVAVFTHVPAQLVEPAGQAHAPLVHTCPAPHTVVQLPQCAASVVVSAHAPLQFG